jgi:hypothetical protein
MLNDSGVWSSIGTYMNLQMNKRGFKDSLVKDSNG